MIDPKLIRPVCTGYTDRETGEFTPHPPRPMYGNGVRWSGSGKRRHSTQCWICGGCGRTTTKLEGVH